MKYSVKSVMRDNIIIPLIKDATVNLDSLNGMVNA